MSSLSILLDEGLGDAKPFLSNFGEVRLFSGRNISALDLHDATVIIVRSITRVDARLLKKSKIKHVYSATSGTDHVDTDYLAKEGISFFNCKGCNAKAVAQYVLSSILLYSAKKKIDFSDLKVGVLGYGFVGKEVVAMLDKLGISYLINDPPLENKISKNHYGDLKRLLKSDVITLHVPLDVVGKYPTQNLINRFELEQLEPNSLIINTSRGGVINEEALLDAISGEKKIWTVIDCWRNEPQVNEQLLRSAWLTTPHIAGRTLESKQKAIEIICNQLLGKNKQNIDLLKLEEKKVTPFKEVKFNKNLSIFFNTIIPLEEISKTMSESFKFDVEKRGILFDNLRAKSLRNEFHSFRVETDSKLEVKFLRSLGFKTFKASDVG